MDIDGAISICFVNIWGRLKIGELQLLMATGSPRTFDCKDKMIYYS
jgi:hypothetical protein